MADETLLDYSKYPVMARWFDPRLLLKLLNNVIVSSVFGQYADRRLIIAALDTVSAEEHLKRATDLKAQLTPAEDGAVWIDWIADLGDGFDSTYAMASLLARENLEVDGLKLPRGQMLIMGGDEVYPTASSQAYQNQLRQPYAWAFPDHDKRSDKGVPVFAIPGNHDWYDGLVLFHAYFCGEKPWHIGSWRTQQRRSYFALQLTNNCWLWAMDIQLADDMDQPQHAYFKNIARGMPNGARIILCSAEPGWLYTNTNSKSWGITEYAFSIAQNEQRDITIPALLSGDTHHYSRYSSTDGKQFITAGGGGAFRHPTHQLSDKIKLKWSGIEKELSLTTAPDGSHQETTTAACYPPKDISRGLLNKNWRFALTNWDFSLLFGLIYWLIGIGLTLRDQWDAYIIVTLIFAAGIMGYTYKQEKVASTAVILSSATHTLAHVLAVIFFASFFANWNATHFILSGQWYSGWKWLFIVLLEMGSVGFFVGSTIYGLNLLFACRYLNMSYNDAFSAFRLNRFNNFLRIRIAADKLEIYAIGLQDVPSRLDWTANPKASHGNPNEPVFVPTKPLAPHIIEKVVVSIS